MSAEEILTQYGEHFMHNNIFESGLRSVLWSILTCLNSIGNSCVNMLDKAYSILTFNIGNSDELKKILDPFSSGAFITALMVLILVCIGIFMILGNNNISGMKIIQNILLGVLIFVGMPLIINTFNNAITSSDLSMEVSMASVFDANIYDIQHMFSGTGNDQPAENQNGFSAEEGAWIDSMNVCEVIRGSKITDDIDDVFSKVYRDGTISAAGNGEVFGVYLEPFANDYYYRYHVDMLPIFITCIATILVIIFTFFKVARLTYEMLWNQLFVKILSVTDMVSGAKLKEAVKAVGGTYVVLIYIPLSIKVFCAFQNWLFSQTTGDNPLFNTFEAALLLIAVAMAVIDGPNLIEKIFGIDAGIKSGFHTALGIMAAGRTAAGVAGKAFSGGKGLYGFTKDMTGASSPIEKRRALKNAKLNKWANDTLSGEGKKPTSNGSIQRDPSEHAGAKNEQKQGVATGAVGRPSPGTAPQDKGASVNKPEGYVSSESTNKTRDNQPAPMAGQEKGVIDKSAQPERATGEVSRPEIKSDDQDTQKGKDFGEALSSGEAGAAAVSGETVTTGAVERPVTANSQKKALDKADALNHTAASQHKATSSSKPTTATSPATPVRERKETVASKSVQRSITETPLTQPSPVPASPETSNSATAVRNESVASQSSTPRSSPRSTSRSATSTSTPKTGKTTSADKGTAEKRAKRKTDLK